jgi:hypothetical protein
VPIFKQIFGVTYARGGSVKNFTSFKDWRRRIDRITAAFAVVGVTLTVIAVYGWKHYPGHETLLNILFWIGMVSFGVSHFLLLRYIGMPTDEEVKKCFADIQSARAHPKG